MTFLQLCFYFFSAVLVFAAGMVVTIRNPVKSALFLVLAFFSAACIWITLEAEFLAIVLVLVYVGAVMVLFLFVVMMLDIDLAVLRAGFTRYLPVGSIVALLLIGEIALVIPFEIAAIILLVAIIAAIALTMRRRPDSKFINPSEQVKVNRDDRLRIVKMKSETKPNTQSGGDE